MTSPFVVCPWQNNFLDALLSHALEEAKSDAMPGLGQAAFVFPHSRAERYLAEMLRHDPRFTRPLLLPRCHTLTGLFKQISTAIQAKPTWEAGLLDRMGLLLSCVRSLPGSRKFLRAATGTGDEARFFFPWGVRLASLFEECQTHESTPEDFQYPDGVSPFAASLLEHLGQIFTLYTKELEQKNWTTPAHTAAFVARHLAQGGHIPAWLCKDKHLYLAGLYALTPTEDRLCRYLWSHYGATVMLHADPAIASKEQGTEHWSCRLLRDWAKNWGASFQLLTQEQTQAPQRNLRYVAGFDLHSQLVAMQDTLTKAAPAPAKAAHFAADTAIILPDTSLLMPCLHHLPDTDCNISMGYPLGRSPLFRLLDAVVSLQERRRGKACYWRDLLDISRHPYLKMLLPLTPEPGEQTPDNKGEQTLELRRVLHRFETEVRSSGSPFVDPFAVLDTLYLAVPEEEQPKAEVLAFARVLLHTIITRFTAPQTPGELGLALNTLAELLHNHGSHLWQRFPIDAECLYRLMQSLIPALTNSSLSNEAFPPATLFTMLRELIKAERVPFDATPLVGLQVLGMLETRLLTFRRVFILDCTDDLLPGVPEGDPLLPEALRPSLGLAPRHNREQIAAYHFFRLLAGVEEGVILWQEGADTPGSFEAKKRKSRFVEELIWEEEKKHHALLQANTPESPLYSPGIGISPLHTNTSHLVRDKDLDTLVERFLKRPLSATTLDDYLRCPLQFAWKHLLGLRPVKDIVENADPLAIGGLLHTVLEDFYTEFLDQPLLEGTLFAPAQEQDMRTVFTAHLEKTGLEQTLPADAFAMLVRAGQERLRRFLYNQPATTVLALEIDLTVAMQVEKRSITLTGKADRIDHRNGATVILDYKTGTIPEHSKNVWTQQELWEQVQGWKGQDDGLSILHTLAEEVGSVQLPLYLTLLDTAIRNTATALSPNLQVFLSEQKTKGTLYLPNNAAWINLGADGEELPLLPQKLPLEEQERIIREHMPALFHFLIQHLATNSCFFARQGPHCRWCSYAKTCMVSSSLPLTSL